MAESASSWLELIVRKVTSVAQKNNWVPRAAEWLGLSELDADGEQIKEKIHQEYQTENYSLRKFSVAWFIHRMRPANKMAWSIFILHTLAGWFGWLDALPSNLFRVYLIEILFFAIWLSLRWAAKFIEGNDPTTALKVRNLARGAFWWACVATCYVFLVRLLLGPFISF